MAASEDLLKNLREACLARGASGIKGLGRTFRIVDDDGSKSLDLEEFIEGIKDFGLKMDENQCRELFKAIDTDSSGKIDFNEFLLKLRPPMSQSRLDIIDTVFKKLDKTGDGVVTVDDLKSVYKVEKHPKYMSGELSKDEVFGLFLSNYDSSGDGKVTKEEFLNYYAGVSSSIDSDTYFDLMMRNAWKI